MPQLTRRAWLAAFGASLAAAPSSAQTNQAAPPTPPRPPAAPKPAGGLPLEQFVDGLFFPK